MCDRHETAGLLDHKQGLWRDYRVDWVYIGIMENEMGPYYVM